MNLEIYNTITRVELIANFHSEYFRADLRHDNEAKQKEKKKQKRRQEMKKKTKNKKEWESGSWEKGEGGGALKGA